MWVLTSNLADIAKCRKAREPNAGADSGCVIKKFKQNFLLYHNVVAFRDTALRRFSPICAKRLKF